MILFLELLLFFGESIAIDKKLPLQHSKSRSSITVKSYLHPSDQDPEFGVLVVVFQHLLDIDYLLGNLLKCVRNLNKESAGVYIFPKQYPPAILPISQNDILSPKYRKMFPPFSHFSIYRLLIKMIDLNLPFFYYCQYY